LYLGLMDNKTVNAQMFGLVSQRDASYPMFLFAVCQFMNGRRWHCEYFEIVDIINTLLVLELAFENTKFKRILEKQTQIQSQDMNRAVRHLLKTFFEIIKAYEVHINDPETGTLKVDTERREQKNEAITVFKRVRSKICPG